MNIEKLVQQCEQIDELAQNSGYSAIHPNTKPINEIVSILKCSLPKAGVTRLASITGFSDLQWPVWISIRPNSKALSQSSGKSTSHLSAMIGAAMEALELYNAEEFNPKQFLSLSYQEATRMGCLDLSKSPIPTDLFSSKTPIKWIYSAKLELNGINKNDQCLIPLNLIKLDFRKRKLDTRFANSSNGLASGFKREEAIAQALLECVERHSSTVSTIYGQGRRMDIASMPENCRDMIGRLTELGLTTAIVDCTYFKELPVFECKLSPNNPNTKFTGGLGWGCHPNPEIALMRSILEANQARTIIISGSRDDMHKNIYLRERVRHRTDDYTNYLHKRLPESSIHFDTNLSQQPLADYLPIAIKALSQKGFKEIYVVPLTEGKETVQVVKVIIPGLEGYHSASYRPIGTVNYRNGPFLMENKLNQHSRMGSIRLNAGGISE